MTLTKQSATKAGRSKAVRARKSLTPAELFFYEQAGYSYDPKTETQEQGRVRCAKSMANDEATASAMEGWHYEWQDDWSVGSHMEEFGKGSAYEDHEPRTCESCVL